MTAHTNARRFPIRYEGWSRGLMRVLGMGPKVSSVELVGDRVSIRMGWAFRLSCPRSSIVAAGADDGRVWGWGVHGWRRSWLVNGSSHGLVRIRLEPACRGRVVLLPWSVDTVRVSVEDPDELIAALAG